MANSAYGKISGVRIPAKGKKKSSQENSAFSEYYQVLPQKTPNDASSDHMDSQTASSRTASHCLNQKNLPTGHDQIESIRTGTNQTPINDNYAQFLFEEPKRRPLQNPYSNLDLKPKKAPAQDDTPQKPGASSVCKSKLSTKKDSIVSVSSYFQPDTQGKLPLQHMPQSEYLPMGSKEQTPLEKKTPLVKGVHKRFQSFQWEQSPVKKANENAFFGKKLELNSNLLIHSKKQAPKGPLLFDKVAKVDKQKKSASFNKYSKKKTEVLIGASQDNKTQSTQNSHIVADSLSKDKLDELKRVMDGKGCFFKMPSKSQGSSKDRKRRNKQKKEAVARINQQMEQEKVELQQIRMGTFSKKVISQIAQKQIQDTDLSMDEELEDREGSSASGCSDLQDEIEVTLFSADNYQNTNSDFNY